MQGSKDTQSFPELAHHRGQGPVPERQQLDVPRGAGGAVRCWAGEHRLVPGIFNELPDHML